MDLSTDLVVAGYVALGGAIMWLARNQVVSQRRCEREGAESRAKQAELDEFIRTKLLAIVGETAGREAESAAILERSRKALERAEKRHPRDPDETPYQAHALGGLAICALLFATLAVSGCIPVTVRPQFDEQGAPIALPVTPTGTISPEGVLTPIYPISTAAPTPPPSFPWETALTAVLGALGIAGGGYGLLIRNVAQKAKTALRLACDLAEAQTSVAEDAASLPPEEGAKVLAQIQRNKHLAAQVQESAGVRKLIQSVRGK